ncbi:peptide deformylase [Streptomyces sp. NPDC015125]|uniref:peptide deformylase n=1 Tax=Streptomyces sp. NPDC015125 TaxID=3364938 RepID=UPI0036F719D9
MGIAAPQSGIGRTAAVVMPPGQAPAIILLNPKITDRSDETDEQCEGCLSFFDVRGLVPRPLKITALNGEPVTTVYERGLAHLIHHEIDHLDGMLYIARMSAWGTPIPRGGVPAGRPGMGVLVSRSRTLAETPVGCRQTRNTWVRADNTQGGTCPSSNSQCSRRMSARQQPSRRIGA